MGQPWEKPRNFTPVFRNEKFSTVVPHKIQSNSTKFSKPKFLANTGLEALFLFSTSPNTAEAETTFIYLSITHVRKELYTYENYLQ